MCNRDDLKLNQLFNFEPMQEVVCNRDDLILNPLFLFEPVTGLEYWGDVKMSGSAGNGTCKFI